MIRMPTGWSSVCEGCQREVSITADVDSWDDVEAYLRSLRWIVMDGFHTFCSLDCLLAYRASPSSRAAMATTFAIHASVQHGGKWCCPAHGKHRAEGHDFGCPDRVRRPVRSYRYP